MSECPDCYGIGFKEYDAGLVQIGCKKCEMTGKVDGDLTKDEFEKAYAFRSDMTLAQVAEMGLVSIPSSEEGCRGWAMVKVEEVHPQVIEVQLGEEAEISGDGSGESLSDIAAEANVYANALMPRLDEETAERKMPILHKEVPTDLTMAEAKLEPKPHKHFYRNDGTCQCGQVKKAKKGTRSKI